MKNCCNYPNIEQCGFTYHRVMLQKDADGMANSVDPEVWSGSVLFAKTCLSENRGASSWDYGTYHIGDQRRLRRACTSAQSHQSLPCSYTWSMEVDEGFDQKQTSSPTGWLRMRIRRISLWRMKSTIIAWHGSIRINMVPGFLQSCFLFSC